MLHQGTSDEPAAAGLRILGGRAEPTTIIELVEAGTQCGRWGTNGHGHARYAVAVGPCPELRAWQPQTHAALKGV